ncbi:hypothetical protein, partial [Limnohabitans sp.]|uniref:hypothetical protein n=1 Tax=Limnohabitans sp. TaxID=1907725 RepID=UPI00333FFAD1
MKELLQRLAWLLLRQQATTLQWEDLELPVLLLEWLPSPRQEGKAMAWISPLQLAQTFACIEHSAPNGTVQNARWHAEAGCGTHTLTCSSAVKRRWLHWKRDAESPCGLVVGCWICNRFSGRDRFAGSKSISVQKCAVERHNKSATHRVAINRYVTQLGLSAAELVMAPSP